VTRVVLLLGFVLLTSWSCGGEPGDDPANRPPTAADDSVTTSQDTAISITLIGNDPDGDELSFEIVSLPAHGELGDLSAGIVLYSPNLDYTGEDSFTFTAADASSSSAPATVSISVTPYENYVFIDPSVSSSGDGSKSSPYKTWADVPAFVPGHTYAQKRGTVARESITVTASGTADNPIVIATYGLSTDPLPKIMGSELETEWTHAGLAEPIYTRSLDLGAGEGLGNAAEDDEMLSFLTWSTDLATTFAEASAGSYTFEPGSGNLHVWTRDGSDPDEHRIEASRRYFGVNVVDHDHITIRDLHISHASIHGVHCQNCGSVSVANCVIDNIGGFAITADPPLYAGNGVEFGESSHDGSVQGCRIEDIFDSGITPQTYSNDQIATGFIFSGNTITRCGLAGIEIAVLNPGGITGASIQDIQIADTNISHCGGGFSGIRYEQEGRAIKVAASAGAGTIDGVHIETTTISDSRGAGIYLNGEIGTVTVHRCKIQGSTLHGIEVSDADSTSLGLRVTSSLIIDNGHNAGANDQVGVSMYALGSNTLELDHNTFSDNGLAGLAIWGFSGDPIFRNNLFTYNTAPAAHLFCNIPLDAATAEHNYYREHGGAIIAVEGATNTPYATVADYQTGTSLGSGSLGGNDPQVDGEYIPLPGSPCIGAGTTSSVNEDHEGKLFQEPPSIGAHAAP